MNVNRSSNVQYGTIADAQDDSSDSFSLDEIPVPINNTFDVTLPATHSVSMCLFAGQETRCLAKSP